MNGAHVRSMGQLHNHLLELTRDVLYPPGRRVQVALACLAIASDHHRAICRLMDDDLPASALALLRPMYEATVKALWISHCAQDTRIELHVAGQELPAVKDMLGAVIAVDRQRVHLHHLQTLGSKRHWKVLSSLVHSGHAQVQNWLAADGVAPNYPETQIAEVVNLVGYLGFIGALERAYLGGASEVANAILDSVRIEELQ